VRAAPVNVGDVLAGKYAVEKVLGSGAMGVVVAARQLELDRRVALKFLTSAQIGVEHRARFLREARAAGKLQGQHVAKVLDVGTLARGEPYIVMEYLDGKDLDAVLEERGPLPVEEAVLYALQVAEALAEAHAAGIVHRDVKPANIFLTRSVDGAPCVKLVDFGVAKVSDGQVHLTGEVQVLGSPLYMSPEALKGGLKADAHTDIWALAVTLYELLAGSHVMPFPGRELLVVMKRIWMDPPAPLAQHRPDVPRGLAAVVEQALQRPLARRFQSVAEFAAALAPYGPARQASYAERVARVLHADTAPALSGVEEPSSAAPQGTPRTLVLAASVLIVGLALAAALFFGLRDRGGGPEPITTATAVPPVIEAPAPPPGSVVVQPSATATAPASAEPATTVARTTPHTRRAKHDPAREAGYDNEGAGQAGRRWGRRLEGATALTFRRGGSVPGAPSAGKVHRGRTRMPAMRNRTLIASLLLSSLSLAPRAFGDTPPQDRAAADALYDESAKLAKENRWPEACARLEASQKLDPAIGTLMRLGSCYEHIGRTASAWTTYHDVMGLAKPDDKRAKQAELDAKRLEPALARMLIEVAPENRAAAVEVRRDGTLLDAGAWGAAVPIDSGAHTVDATGSGKQPWKTTITVEAAPGVTTVRVPVLQSVASAPDALVPAAPVPAAPAPVATAAPADFWRPQRIAGLTVGVAGVAGVIVGAVFGVRAMNKNSASKQDCSPADPNFCNDTGVSLRGDAQTAATISTAALVIGGAAITGGVVLFATTPSGTKPEAARLELAPRPGGLAMQGRFW
jgi:eukaryotic-like serine/threonine-protein kinase